MVEINALDLYKVQNTTNAFEHEKLLNRTNEHQEHESDTTGSEFSVRI